MKRVINRDQPEVYHWTEAEQQTRSYQQHQHDVKKLPLHDQPAIPDLGITSVRDVTTANDKRSHRSAAQRLSSIDFLVGEAINSFNGLPIIIFVHTKNECAIQMYLKYGFISFSKPTKSGYQKYAYNTNHLTAVQEVE